MGQSGEWRVSLALLLLAAAVVVVVVVPPGLAALQREQPAQLEDAGGRANVRHLVAPFAAGAYGTGFEAQVHTDFPGFDAKVQARAKFLHTN